MPREKLEPRKCANERCQKEFIPRAPHGKYCQPACRTQQWMNENLRRIDLKEKELNYASDVG